VGLVISGLVSAAVFVWAAFSGRATVISAPIFFVGIGFVVAEGLGVAEAEHARHVSAVAVEVTLAWVLFVDASRVQLADLREDIGRDTRLLVFGLPLTIALGALAATAVLDLTPWYAILVGAALAPTDAALGSAVMADPRVPYRIRQTLNVESGLNDGIATPVVTFALVMIVTGSDAARNQGSIHALLGLLLGAAVGLLLGGSGAVLLRFARQKGWSSDELGGPAVLALALLAFLIAVQMGANGFVSAFLAGSAFGTLAGRGGDVEVYYVEQTCGLASMIAWFLFGAIAVPVIVSDWSWQILLYAVLSLTVVRMVPVALSLLGAGLDWPTVFFVGWFGPRGLASIVFALLALEELHAVPGAAVDEVIATIGLTVLLSVFLHGLSGHPLAGWYAARNLSAEEISREPVLRRLTPAPHATRR